MKKRGRTPSRDTFRVLWREHEGMAHFSFPRRVFIFADVLHAERGEAQKKRTCQASRVAGRGARRVPHANFELRVSHGGNVIQHFI